jgi:hypothetical protein
MSFRQAIAVISNADVPRRKRIHAAAGTLGEFVAERFEYLEDIKDEETRAIARDAICEFIAIGMMQQFEHDLAERKQNEKVAG